MTISANPKPRPNWRNPIHLLAFGLGSGAAPKAPGTFGTLAAVPLYLLLQPLANLPYLALLVLLFLLGIWLCGRTSRDLGVHDHGGIVWDEWVGFLITMWMAPQGWQWLLAGFCVFRFFDILKPWPIGLLDRKVSGGLGIMLDDVLAGVYGFVLIQLAVHLLI
ncbi:phosphatidylglycerophosphatase A family protein [Sedimenticola sp.]|uniref:phosphatidylglycerophosphatase A family protein n=1 Tax=Sedimenticola sp. TaxID=1940285 RepID=UPI003D126210